VSHRQGQISVRMVYGQVVQKSVNRPSGRRQRLVTGLARAAAIVCLLLLCDVSPSYAFTAGVCEFEDPEDVANAINSAIMNNPDKYNALDLNGNDIADSLEAQNHSMTNPNSPFGNYMCSEFAALAICVLKLEYNCTDEDVQMAHGPAVGSGGAHAVTALNQNIMRSNGGNQPVDGFVHVDFSWPDWNENHLQHRRGGGVSVRDGLLNAGPAECADGFAVARGGGGGGLFGSGGGGMMTQMLLSSMMSRLMNRTGERKDPPQKIKDAYEALQRRIREQEQQQAAASATAAAAAQGVADPEPTAGPVPTETAKPERVSSASLLEDDPVQDEGDLLAEGDEREEAESEQALKDVESRESSQPDSLGSREDSRAGMRLPPDPAL
jgi:hypothetical protein